MNLETEIKQVADPVEQVCFKMIASWTDKRKAKGDLRDWTSTLVLAMSMHNRQAFPKKLYKKMQNYAKANRMATLTSNNPFIRNLLKPFKWKWAPNWKTKDDFKESLEKMHTRRLLDMLRSSYVDHQQDNAQIEAIKAILATRPHVPNKEESRAIRKQKIKQGV